MAQARAIRIAVRNNVPGMPSSHADPQSAERALVQKKVLNPAVALVCYTIKHNVPDPHDVGMDSGSQAYASLRLHWAAKKAAKWNDVDDWCLPVGLVPIYRTGGFTRRLLAVRLGVHACTLMRGRP